MIRDMHLAAATLGYKTPPRLESVGFVEDKFSDCRNCSPTSYHATFRGDQSDVGDELWTQVKAMLREDSSFTGALELERTIHDERFPANVRADENVRLPALPIEKCPPDRYKACDVHIGVALTPAGQCLAVPLLDQLGIASFRKDRAGVSWRIYTATFDHLEDGELFYEAIRSHALKGIDTECKFKLEETVCAFRHPDNAPVLPLTYRNQLMGWLAHNSGECSEESISGVLGRSTRFRRSASTAN